MAVANPYLIHIVLTWPDGSSANQNQIARVKAWDVHNGLHTEQGQSGFNPGTGGWYPVVMQNVGGFYPGREHPNLKFEVWSTQEQNIHTTQVFANIASGSTVHIVIGQGATLTPPDDEGDGGDDDDAFRVYGTLLDADGVPLAGVTVEASDVTAANDGSGAVRAVLGATQSSASGSYSIDFQREDFSSNGAPHEAPNLQVRVFGEDAALLVESQVHPAAPKHTEINLKLGHPDQGSGDWRVHGSVTNELKLAVANVVLEVFHLAWTKQGLREVAIGTTASDAGGRYQLRYDPPAVDGELAVCATEGAVNLLVYAKTSGGEMLAVSEVVANASRDQRVDLKVDHTASSTDSEYQRLHEALAACLGSHDGERYEAINQLDARPEYRRFIAQASGQPLMLIEAYVRAWLNAGEINEKVPAAALSEPMAPEVIYGLLRSGFGPALTNLLDIQPAQFLQVLIDAIFRGTISSRFEARLRHSDAGSLQDDWRIVLGKLLAQVPSDDPAAEPWQKKVLDAVFGDPDVYPELDGIIESVVAGDVQAHAVTMPAVVGAGDLLLMLFCNDGDASATPPTGWTQLFSDSHTNELRLSVFAKRAAGTEGGTTVNVQTSAHEPAVAQLFHVLAGSWFGDIAAGIEISGPATGNSTRIDPPRVDAGWGTAKNRAIAVAAHVRAEELEWTPSQYAVTRTASHPAGEFGACTLLSGHRRLTQANTDPGAFRIPTAEPWLARSLMIRPPTLEGNPAVAKKEAVAQAHYDYEGRLEELLEALVGDGVITAQEAEDIRFVLELYEAVDRHFPIVAAVYAEKAHRNWRTVADLASVALADAPGVKGWMGYVLDSLAYNQGKYPGDVPGSQSEKQRVYAARLFERFGGSHPQKRFTAKASAAAGEPPPPVPGAAIDYFEQAQAVLDFLESHPEFDLERDNIHSYLERHGITLDAAVLRGLEQLQRVYRLTSDYDAAAKLIALGLDSAVKLARLDEDRFIADHEVDFGLTEARNIHRTATHYSSEILFALVKFNQNLNDVGGMSGVSGPADLSLLDPSAHHDSSLADGEDSSAARFPNWTTLFAGFNQCACEHCQTVLSPGAYLVELLEFVAGAPRNLLFERRPDLVDIELSCANTNTVVPYIDLVNEILEGVVATRQFQAQLTQDVLDGAVNREPAHLQTLREVLAAQGYSLGENALVKRSVLFEQQPEWVIEEDAWRFSIRGSSSSRAVHPFAQTSGKDIGARVFPEHVHRAAYAVLEASVFPFELPLSLGKEEIELLLRQRNSARHEVLEVFDPGPLLERLQNPSTALAYLKLSQPEAASVLHQVAAQPYAYWGFDNDEAQIQRPDKPTLELSGHWVELLTRVPVFLHRSGLGYQELLDLLDTRFVHQQAEAHDDHAQPVLHLTAEGNALIECNINEYQIAHLNADTLTRISSFIRLWRKLGFSMHELDHYLMFFVDAAVPADLVQVSLIVRLCAELEVAPLTAMAWWAPLDARRTERRPKSLFDETFLVGLPSQPEYVELDRVPLGHRIDLTLVDPDVDFQAHVRSALGLNSAELEALWAAIVPGTELGLEELTGMYRVATLSHALGLEVGEFYELLDLTELSPFPDATTSVVQAIEHTFLLIEERHRLGATRLSSPEVLYLLRHRGVPEDPHVPSPADLRAVVRELASVATAIAAEFPEQPGDVSTLNTAFARIMPADKVVRVIEVIQGPEPPPEAPLNPTPEQQAAYQAALAAYGTELANFASEGRALLERYLAVYLSPESLEPQGLLDRLLEYDPAYTHDERYAEVWGELRTFLLNRRLRAGALEVATEVASLDRDAVDALLQRALTRTGNTSGPVEPALNDWVQMLRGSWVGLEGEALPAHGGDPQPYRTQLVVPQGGEYRFVVQVEAELTAPPSLVIEGLEAQPTVIATESEPGVTRFVYSPVSLEGGAVQPLQLESSEGASRLLWRIDNADAAPVPSSALVPFLPQAHTQLVKAALLINGLELTKVELQTLLNDSSLELSLDALPLQAPPLDASEPVPWSALAQFIDRLRLNRSIELADGTLFELLARASELDSSHVAIQTRWNVEDLAALVQAWTPGEAAAWADPALWERLERAMRVVRRLDLKVSQMVNWLLGPPTLGKAASLRNALRSLYSDTTWRDTFKPLRDQLRQRQRDALAGYLTSRPVTRHDGQTYHFFNQNDVFAHFLIDVAMEPDTELSRIKLALNSIQLFVHRVFLGLEGDDVLEKLEESKQQWDWMANYRVWEANRKVFLYPENWIEPELRDDKTEIFKELEEELRKEELTNERAEIALSNYLDKLNEVSNLSVVGVYAEGLAAGDTQGVLHVVARTRSQPRTYYYRKLVGNQFHDGRWLPWAKIPFEIKGDTVAPVVHNGRLHLFWPIVKTKQKSDLVPSDEGVTEQTVTGDNIAASRATYQSEINLMWSEYVAEDNKWLKPRLSTGSVLDALAPTPFERDVRENEPRTEPYHLRVAAAHPDRVGIEVIRSNLPNEDHPEGLSPTLLGTFQFWFTGSDTLELAAEEGLGLSLGDNYPTGTIFKHNAAEESYFSFEAGVEKPEALQLNNSVPFFDRTPDTFRFFATNFGYVGDPAHQPFFYETVQHSLFAFNRGPEPGASFDDQQVQVASFQTFNHPLVRELQSRLHTFGVAGIMDRRTEALPQADGRYYSNYYYNYSGDLYLGYHIAGDEQAYGTAQRIFEVHFEPSAQSVQRPYPLPTIEFGYGKSYGVYNWELFFHAPMLIAGQLSQDLKFEQAMRWYHYVFDPKQELNTYERTRSWVKRLPVGARYWNFLPFFANKDTTDSLLDTLGLRDTLTAREREELSLLIDEWKRNPFNPHLIARQRTVAYQKHVVLKYLDNLIAWADQLFRLDSFESINQATQLYILAADLLGDRPQRAEPLVRTPRLTYRELEGQGIEAFTNAVVQLETRLVSNREHVKETRLAPQSMGMKSVHQLTLKSFFFKIPRNERLDQYWDTVADRLFKIRNSMNIDGIKRTLALFQPPIDPALLVKAAAAGLDLGGVVSQLNTPLPHYRFATWLQRANELTGELRSFSAALLAALEKRDAEQLQLLRQGHEIRLQQLVLEVRKRQVAEAEENITALVLSRAMAEERHAEYRRRERINAREATQRDLTAATTVLEAVQGSLQTLSALFAPVPDAQVGIVGILPLAGTNLRIGTALQSGTAAGAAAVGTAASITRGLAALAGISAGFDRRWEEWKLQERLAIKEMTHIDQQIAVARIRLEIARQELANHDKQMEQSLQVQEFLQDKFTSRELYQWMVTQISRSYQQMYQLAYDVAKTAERTYQFELGAQDTFIQFEYRDNLRQGLLAGDKLLHDLKRLDLAYLQRNQREFEITKPISLAQLNPEALQRLRETGVCQFELPEVLFDLDFPGQYFRRIKAVRLTIPAVTGPYTSVSAKLTLLSSAIRKQSTAGPEYAYQGVDDARFVHDLVGIQSIATSTAQNDAGLFELNFRDERYLPFEGAGAISRWRLELPTAARQFEYHSISDVVLQLSYTARDAGGSLRTGAEAGIVAGLNRMLKLVADSDTGLVRVLSMKREFPDALHRLLTEQAADLTLLPRHFPFVIRDAGLSMELLESTIDVRVQTRGDASDASLFVDGTQPAGQANLGPPNEHGVMMAPVSLVDGSRALLPDWEPQTWALAQENLTPENTDDVLFVVRYTVS